MRYKECPVCKIPFDEPWHNANGWGERMVLHEYFTGPFCESSEEFKLRPNESNCCYCPHHDCTNSNCEDYHNNVEMTTMLGIIAKGMISGRNYLPIFTSMKTYKIEEIICRFLPPETEVKE